MNSTWKKKGKAHEDDFFERKEKELLERLKERMQVAPHPSPVTGQPMEHVQINGVILERCTSTGGIWFDAGDLKQVIDGFKQEDKTWIDSFLTKLAELCVSSQ